MIGINGKFPGPTVQATVGDIIVVELKNNLHTEGVVIHWHGIGQFGTPWADGTASISQCAINPGETFNYRFTVDKAGTYFYHGHYGMQSAAGLYRSLIINLPEGEKEPFHYDKEFNLLLSDWYHQNVYVQAAGLSSIPFRWIGEPQLIAVLAFWSNNNKMGARNENFTMKPVPSQVSYMRFPGTTSADCIDYLVTDKGVVGNNLW